MYFYILSSDVKSPWNYNLAFFDILLTTLSIECLCIEYSFIRILRLIIRLSFNFFFFSSDNPCVESSSFDKPCFIRWQVLVFHLLFLFLIAFAFRQSHATLFVVRKKCILISTATALLFTLAWFLSFDIPDEWYYCWETVKKQDLFSDTIRNERYTLK